MPATLHITTNVPGANVNKDAVLRELSNCVGGGLNMKELEIMVSVTTDKLMGFEKDHKVNCAYGELIYVGPPITEDKKCEISGAIGQGVLIHLNVSKSRFLLRFVNIADSDIYRMGRPFQLQN